MKICNRLIILVVLNILNINFLAAQVQIAADDTTDNQHYGKAVAIDGDYIAVGASRDSDAGAVYIHYRDQGGSNNWGVLTKIQAGDHSYGSENQFGISVSLDLPYLIVGANRDDASGVDAGSVYIFDQNQGSADNWGQVTKFQSTDVAAGDFLGTSVSLNGDILVVGAPTADISGSTDAGAAYVFYKDQGGTNAWGQVTKITSSDYLSGDDFGHSVSVSGTRILCGAHLRDEGGVDRGAGYLFSKDQNGTDAWGQTHKKLPDLPGKKLVWGICKHKW